MADVLFGPSHAVRLRHALATEQLPNVFPRERIVGVGGMPIWSPRIREELAKGAEAPFFVVGDFRFGNRILARWPESGEPKGEFLAIEKDLISEENDDRMRELALAAIDRIAAAHPSARFLFWDLTIREYEARSAGRYMTDGVYRHPNWNLSDVLARYPGHAIDTTGIVTDAAACYIDSSCHPSLLGWSFIHASMRDGEAPALNELREALHEGLRGVLDSALDEAAVAKLVVTGDSKFTRLLSHFVRCGSLALPRRVEVVPLAKATAGNAGPDDLCLFFPNIITHPFKTESELQAATATVAETAAGIASHFPRSAVLFYDNWASERISTRREYLGRFVSAFPQGQTQALEAVSCAKDQPYRVTESEDFEGLIELNDTVIPTTLGFLELLIRPLGGRSHRDVADAYARLSERLFGRS